MIYLYILKINVIHSKNWSDKDEELARFAQTLHYEFLTEQICSKDKA